MQTFSLTGNAQPTLFPVPLLNVFGSSLLVRPGCHSVVAVLFAQILCESAFPMRFEPLALLFTAQMHLDGGSCDVCVLPLYRIIYCALAFAASRPERSVPLSTLSRGTSLLGTSCYIFRSRFLHSLRVASSWTMSYDILTGVLCTCVVHAMRL